MSVQPNVIYKLTRAGTNMTGELLGASITLNQNFKSHPLCNEDETPFSLLVDKNSESLNKVFFLRDEAYEPLEVKAKYTAPDIMKEGMQAMLDRASERDTEGERSMGATVKSFNAMYGLDLTEEQGWMFMVFLKAARAKGGDFRKDDYVDGAAYFALAGEAHGK